MNASQQLVADMHMAELLLADTFGTADGVCVCVDRQGNKLLSTPVVLNVIRPQQYAIANTALHASICPSFGS